MQFLTKTNVEYLGYIISHQIISISVEMIKGIMKWPTLKNVIDVRSFM